MYKDVGVQDGWSSEFCRCGPYGKERTAKNEKKGHKNATLTANRDSCLMTYPGTSSGALVPQRSRHQASTDRPLQLAGQMGSVVRGEREGQRLTYERTADWRQEDGGTQSRPDTPFVRPLSSKTSRTYGPQDSTTGIDNGSVDVPALMVMIGSVLNSCIRYPESDAE